MKAKQVSLNPNPIVEVFRKAGGLDTLNVQRIKGNLKPTNFLIEKLKPFIENSPASSVVANVKMIKNLLGEEDQNTVLFQRLETLIQARIEKEKGLGNTAVAMGLQAQTLQVLIQDSININAMAADASASTTQSSTPD